MRKQFHWTEKAAVSGARFPAHQGGRSWEWGCGFEQELP